MRGNTTTILTDKILTGNPKAEKLEKSRRLYEREIKDDLFE